MDYDVVIVGGGMVGAALGCALQRPTLRIALIDANAALAKDSRLIALNHSSYLLLKNLLIWPAIAPHATVIQQVHVSSRGQFGSTCLKAQDVGLTELGYVVPAHHLNTALYAALTSVDILRPTELVDLTQHTDHVHLQLTDREITTGIVIAADGTHSTVRRCLNIPTETIDYHQQALVTITQLSRSHHHTAYERFLPTGAIAMLPLPDQQAATIWSDTDTHIARLLALTPSDFLQELQQQFGYRLGRFTQIAERVTYPLKFVKALKQVEQRVLLIGNAAHTVHPIAAQGLNLALHEIAVLAEHWHSTDRLSLENLPTHLQPHHLNFSHRLTQWFSTDFLLGKLVRQVGMVGLDVCQVGKKRFIQRALGKATYVPKLLLEQEVKD